MLVLVASSVLLKREAVEGRTKEALSGHYCQALKLRRNNIYLASTTQTAIVSLHDLNSRIYIRERWDHQDSGIEQMQHRVICLSVLFRIILYQICELDLNRAECT
jgi:hypothetical protein